MTFLDMQQMRQVGSPTPSPDGSWLLYTLSTPDWKEAKRQTDIYLVSLQHGRVVDAADDVHEGEERNLAALGARRQRLRLPVEPRGAGKRGVAQSALRDAARRRRSAPAHRYARGRVGLRVQPRRPLAGLSQRQERRGTAVSAAAAGDRDRDRGTDHQAPDRRRSRGSGRPTAGASTSSRPIASTRTRRRGARRSSPSTSATPKRRSPSLWALDLDPIAHQAPHRRRHLLGGRLRRSPTTASGSASADSSPTATSAASPPRTSTATCICSKPPPARSSG